MAGDRRNQPWAEMLQQNDDKHEAAHKRLRSDHRELEEQHEALKAKVQQLANAVEQQQHDLVAARTAPIDIGLIVFNPKMVAAIVSLAVAIVGGNWFFNQPIRDGLTVLREQVTGNTRIEEERARTNKESVDVVVKGLEMRRLEIQQVSNSVQQLQQQVQQLQRGKN